MSEQRSIAYASPSRRSARMIAEHSIAATLALAFLLNAPALASCAGDCDGDGAVSIDELVHGVQMILTDEPITTCLALDINGDGRVTIGELITAVNAAVIGCAPSTTPSPTPTPTARATLAPDSELYREFDRVSRGACDRDRVQILEGLLSFGCTTGRGHNASLTIETFPDLETAQARFEQLAAPGAATEYKEFPAVYWEEGAQLPPFQPREHLVWLADCAVVNVQSFNESAYGAVPDARQLSDIMVSWIRGYVVRTCIQ